MADHQEVELKLRVDDLDAVRRRLEALGARLTAPRVYERNVRYDDAARTLSNGGMVLRLRQDSRVRLTYKEESASGTKGDAHTRFEAEVEVSDFDTMHLILDKLGYRPYMIYEKYRTTYELDGAEIVLDEMPYGTFVEIEGDAEVIAETRDRLQLSHAPVYDVGYASLFNRVRHHLRLPFADLTFDNFQGIDVPPAAFEPDES